MPKDFYLQDAINVKLSFLKAGGLINLWHLADVNKEPSNVNDQKYPKALTVSQLMGGFQTLYMGCGIGFLTFIAEVIKFKLHKIHF